MKVKNSENASAAYNTEVVIGGISCRLPESDNAEECQHNLMNGIDMVTEDDRRWPPGIYGLPKRSGKLKDISKFDASFFGVHPKQANSMDPQLRLLLEVTYEAITDAGINPNSTKGSKTGVFIGCTASESHDAWSCDPSSTVGYNLIGCTKSMFANRISFFFDFKGPSYAIDTACSSSLVGVDIALRSINQGQCDSAIVGGCHLCLRPTTSVQFDKLGMLSKGGTCKSFDASGDGYCRSEGVVVVYLQKRSNAKRIYCTVVHSKTNSDGNKEQGITFPSGALQKQLLQEVYREARIDPSTVEYVEAHGTGTKAGDTQELNTITDVFCKGRETPLLIGSIKSNMGHPEPASGLAGILKLIITMERNLIPANLHYKSPNLDIPGLVDGRLKVVTKTTKFNGGLMAINSFGFGGSNVHAVLKPNDDNDDTSVDLSQRLLVYTARTEEGLERVLKAAEYNSGNIHFHALLNGSCSNGQVYRGYSVLNTKDEIREIQAVSIDERRPVWFVFSGMGSQWNGMGKQMMTIPLFKECIQKLDVVLKPFDVELYKWLSGGLEEAPNDIIYSFIGIASIQIALVDLLFAMGVHPDGIVGHSVGELGSGYADGSLTAEETILAAYWRGKCIKDADLPLGGMAAIGLSWEEAHQRCPPGIYPACHNSEDNVTVSGPAILVADFVKKLKEQHIFAKEINIAGVAFHSPCMKAVGPTLNSALQKVVVPKRRSDKWISSSIPECNWHTDLAEYSSADYHANNLVSPVLFHEALKHVSNNAVIIEIAPNCLLQSILKRSLGSNCSFVGLMKQGHPNNVEFFLSSLGKCFLNGVELDPLRICHEVHFPVPKGTPMISPLINWDHSASWNVATFNDFPSGPLSGKSGVTYEIDMSENSPDNYLRGHVIDGRVLFPASGYIVLAWKTFAKIKGKNYQAMPVKFENVNIKRVTMLPSEGKVQFTVNILESTGTFEITENNALISNGSIYPLKEPLTPVFKEKVDLAFSKSDIYKELRLRGYEYGQEFKGIHTTSIEGDAGELLWNGNWVSYIDALLQMSIFGRTDDIFRLPSRINYMNIHPDLQHAMVYQNQTGENVIFAKAYKSLNTFKAGGLEIIGFHATEASRRPYQNDLVITQNVFLPNICDFQEWNEFSESKNNCTSCIGLKESGQDVDICKKHCDFDNRRGYQLPTSIEDGDDNSFEQVNKSSLSSIFGHEMLKPCLDIVIENIAFPTMIKVVEISTGKDGMHKYVYPLLTVHPIVSNVAYVTCNSPGTSHDIYTNVEIIEWDLESTPPVGLTNANLVVAQGILCQQKNLTKALSKLSLALNENDGFLLIEENTRNCLEIFNPISESVEENNRTNSKLKLGLVFGDAGYNLIFTRSNGSSTLFLLRPKRTTETKPFSVIQLNDLTGSWLDNLKQEVANINDRNLWLIVNSEPKSGILGLFKCLKLEPGGENIRCIFICDINGPKICLEDYDFKFLLENDLVMNVYKNGKWGSYRQLTIKRETLIQQTLCHHAFVDVRTKGDLSSLTWIESPVKFYHKDDREILCHVQYAALNFRDVMLATGRISAEAIPGELFSNDCILGMEISGFDGAGNRVMGLVPSKGLATTVVINKKFQWSIPYSWSLIDAATVPVAFATAYYALVVRGRIKHGERILIHSGSGGVGQAAIAVALSYGCEVFTTVGSNEKKAFLQNKFPQLKDQNFSSSRSTEFANHFMEITKGKGVHVVLNSLSEDKLQASIKILAQHGRFLEIGKFDLANNNSLGMSVFLKNISFHGILLDALFEEDNEDWKEVAKLLTHGIQSGAVKPLNATVFNNTQVEEAFKCIAKGKHLGKVLVKVRNELGIAHHSTIHASPRIYFNPKKSYIITGGLGGFGLELAKWLICRGARNLVLTSRSGIKTGYQTRMIEQLRRKGITVRISKHNIVGQEACEQLFKESSSIEPIGGIFHLAMVLKDGLLQNLTKEQFDEVCEPKINGTLNLDIASRNLCKSSLDWFVVFSSQVCENGNAGQTSYGFANSAMERICEDRVNSNLPGLAIQWGAIDDVGIAIETRGTDDIVIAGTRPQKIASCLHALDMILTQCTPIVSCYVPAEKHLKECTEVNLVDSVFRILGVTDTSSIKPNRSLGELGLDSLMVEEVRNTLERKFGVFLSMPEIQHLTLDRMKNLNIQISEGK